MQRKAIFEIHEIENGAARGDLCLLDGDQETRFDAISGPYGKGHLPIGVYKITSCYLLAEKEGVDLSAYKVDAEPWVAQLSPCFDTDRTGFLVHGDGGVVGTKGCIGVVKNDKVCFLSIRDMLKDSDGEIELIVEHKGG